MAAFACLVCMPNKDHRLIPKLIGKYVLKHLYSLGISISGLLGFCEPPPIHPLFSPVFLRGIYNMGIYNVGCAP